MSRTSRLLEAMWLPLPSLSLWATTRKATTLSYHQQTVLMSSSSKKKLRALALSWTWAQITPKLTSALAYLCLCPKVAKGQCQGSVLDKAIPFILSQRPYTESQVSEKGPHTSAAISSRAWELRFTCNTTTVSFKPQLWLPGSLPYGIFSLPSLPLC